MNGKGSKRRPEDSEAIRRNWPFPDPPRARQEGYPPHHWRDLSDADPSKDAYVAYMSHAEYLLEIVDGKMVEVRVDPDCPPERIYFMPKDHPTPLLEELVRREPERFGVIRLDGDE